MDRAAIKKKLHAARVSLDYQMKTDRPARVDRTEAIAKARARVDELAKLYQESEPEVFSLSHRSIHFIGPIRPRGKRGDGATIVCFRCGHDKSREEFYSKGTVCRACVVKRSGEWADKNPSKVILFKNRYAQNNPEKYQEMIKKSAAKNRLKKNAKAKEYHRLNRGKRNAWTREYLRRKKKDPQWRALLTCKRRMWILFKSVGRKKTLRSAELLGIDRAGFFKHIESLFKPGMTWNNRGKYGWHIDHIKPCALFDMTDDDQARDCWHYTNLQPLWCHENWAKSDNYTEPKDIDGDKISSVPEVATVEQSTA